LTKEEVIEIKELINYWRRTAHGTTFLYGAWLILHLYDTTCVSRYPPLTRPHERFPCAGRDALRDGGSAQAQHTFSDELPCPRRACLAAPASAPRLLVRMGTQVGIVTVIFTVAVMSNDRATGSSSYSACRLLVHSPSRPAQGRRGWGAGRAGFGRASRCTAGWPRRLRERNRETSRALGR